MRSALEWAAIVLACTLTTLLAVPLLFILLIAGLVAAIVTGDF